MKWEYRIVNFWQQEQVNCNKYGAQGWELVSVHELRGQPAYYFKREIPNERINEQSATLSRA